MNKKVKEAIRAILDMHWWDEHKHWQEHGRPKNHIFNDLRILAKAIRYKPADAKVV